MPLGTTRDPCSILKGTIWEPNGQFARLSQRDPVGSPLTKTGGIPTGIPCGPREASQMGPFRVPIGMSGWVPTGHMTRSMRSELLAFNISKSTGKSGNLESHKLYVLSNRRLRDCRFSGKRFKCTHELKRHVYTHTGAKPYPCGHCSDSFTLVRDLKAHLLKSHNEGTWFICHTCQKKFSLSSHLKQHLLRHEAVEW